MRVHLMPGPLGTVRSLLVALVVLAAVFAGCVADPAPSHAAPTLVEAHGAASDRAKAQDRSAHLVGFMASDRLDDAPVPSWLMEQVGTLPAAGAGLSQGHSAAWVLLYATSDGRVMRALVDESTRVQLDWIVYDSDPVAQALWGMNLGGRLLVDSPAALEAARSADERFDEHARANPDAGVAVASTIATVADSTTDLVYAVYWGPPANEEPFSRFAYVHHFTGDVVLSGDSSTYRQDKRVVLVDEEFTLGPVPLEVHHEERLGFKVEDAVFSLTASGVGHYSVRLLHENRTEAVHVEDVALVQPKEHVESLGTLEPGLWVLQVEVLGQVDFHLRIEGVVPVSPGGHP